MAAKIGQPFSLPLIPLTLAVTLANAWFAHRSQSSVAAFPLIEPAQAAISDADLPFVTIIVPARNEAANIGRLVSSLVALDYPAYRVIVVDDASSDATGEIAAGIDSSVQVVRGNGPAPGWTGKNYACHLGRQAAGLAQDAEWLLFTDADTWHTPGSLRAIVNYALANGLDAVSVFPGQECKTFWEKLLLPYAYFQFFSGLAAAHVNEPGAPEALANGQYMLIRWDAYNRIGGHAAVRASVIEDVALAHAMKRAGVPFQLCRAEQLVHVRMYSNLGSIWEGFSKNSFQFIQIGGKDGILVVAGSITLAAVPALILRNLSIRSLVHWLAATLAYLVPVLGLTPTYRRFGVSASFAWLHPLAVSVFQSIAFNSMYRVLARRGVHWKGRSYG